MLEIRMTIRVVFKWLIDELMIGFGSFGWMFLVGVGVLNCGDSGCRRWTD